MDALTITPLIYVYINITIRCALLNIHGYSLRTTNFRSLFILVLFSSFTSTIFFNLNYGFHIDITFLCCHVPSQTSLIYCNHQIICVFGFVKNLKRAINLHLLHLLLLLLVFTQMYRLRSL